MKQIAVIKAPSSQGITIATIWQDDRQTGEFKLQDDYSAQGVWYKTFDDLKADWRNVSFMRAHCNRLECENPTIVFTGDKYAGISLGFLEKELK